MKGGVVHNQSHNSIHDAITYFLENSTLEILTNSSISCVTFVATLNPDAPSSLISSRDNTFGDNTYGKPVTKLLIKLFPISLTSFEKSRILFLKGERGPHENMIEVTTREKFENEFNTQLEIYNISYNANYNSNADKYDAICPRPIHRTIELISYVDTLLNKITTDDKNKKNLSNMFRVIKSNNVSHVGILYMEMMDGWYLLEEVLDSTRVNEIKKIFFKNMFRYVIDRLHKIGFIHGDPHQRNAMVNLKYPYLTNTNKSYFGRVILIDFGKTRRISQKEFDDEKKILNDEGIYYQGKILNKNANYETIKELRSKFNEERRKRTKEEGDRI